MKEMLLLFSALFPSSDYEFQHFSVEALLLYDIEKGWLKGTQSHRIPRGYRAAYAFNSFVAVELSDLHYGRYRKTTDDGHTRRVWNEKASALTGGIRVSLPLKARFSLVGRVGAARRKEEAQWNYRYVGEGWHYEMPASSQSRKFRTHGYYGAGLQLDVASRGFVGIEYTATINSSDLGSSKSALSVGVRF
ncbi:outer membrane beta-barrel protein [Marinimicrobium sp. ABcell2]|uniref:outer membrane beta-barrel protein n=1 Tax=Marinimicrobium sp. ABcell2 TaxID=3069751 RepID=UPI0027B003AF|nr:outer membrane beta-barrel protein [Marinimicrobium sp. ABcell2]MDQ2077967.1 outer membrane beta-barrel protein [Marinimicrobium sp. ABcell2]